MEALAEYRLDRGDGWQALEQEFVDDIRWWTLAELEVVHEPVHPPGLARMVEWRADGEPQPRPAAAEAGAYAALGRKP